MWRFVVLVGVGVYAQTPELPPASMLLARIKAHMIETLSRMPNYTCLETVERSLRDRSAGKYRLADTLRIEVALLENKEMFAWPGSKQFEEGDFRKFIPNGTFGTGEFALHARWVFGSNAATFVPRGEQTLDGRLSVRYDFEVPRERSGYQIHTGPFQAIVGYHGSFYADPESLDLMRLEVVGDNLPVMLKLSSVSDRMDYQRIRIGDGTFLLPSSSEVVLVDLNGDASRNRLRFTGCRQFSGQSTLSFDDPAPRTDSVAPLQKAELNLPANLQFALSLMDDIDTDSAAIGDPVRAQLYSELKQRGRILAPKGAMASGRISRIERHQDFTVIGFVFTELESNAVHARLDLRFDRVAGAETFPPNRGFILNAPPMEHEGLVPLRSGRVRVMRGTLMFWRT